MQVAARLVEYHGYQLCDMNEIPRKMISHLMVAFDIPPQSIPEYMRDQVQVIPGIGQTYESLVAHAWHHFKPYIRDAAAKGLDKVVKSNWRAVVLPIRDAKVRGLVEDRAGILWRVTNLRERETLPGTGQTSAKVAGEIHIDGVETDGSNITRQIIKLLREYEDGHAPSNG